MFDLDKWNEILTVLGRNKLRTFLTAFGVFWGMLMLTIMLGAGQGLENGVVGGFKGYATNSMFLWARSTTMAYEGFQPGRNFRLNNSDVEQLMETMPELELVAPRLYLGGFMIPNNVTYKGETAAYIVTGEIPESRQMNPVYAEHGRFFNKFDMEEKRKVCVIGQGVYEDLYLGGEDPIGTFVKVSGVYFKVVGVMNSDKAGQEGDRYRDAVQIPLRTFQQAFNMGDDIGSMAVQAYPEYDIEELEREIKYVIAKNHHIHPEDEFAFGSWNFSKTFKNMQNLFLGIKILTWIVGIGTLLAGIIGISNIMLIIIKERTVELGVRRAIGAKAQTILSQILSESVFLTMLAGAVGLLAGVWAIEGLDAMMGDVQSSRDNMFANPSVELPVILMALVILVISGALAGVIPAIRALAIKPIDALRNA